MLKKTFISLQLNNGKSTHMITLYDNVRLSDVNDELMNKIYNSMMFLLSPHSDVLIHSIKLTNYSHYEMYMTLAITLITLKIRVCFTTLIIRKVIIIMKRLLK